MGEKDEYRPKHDHQLERVKAGIADPAKTVESTARMKPLRLKKKTACLNKQEGLQFVTDAAPARKLACRSGQPRVSVAVPGRGTM